MKKNILLLPGTRWQIDIASTIKRKGYGLYIVDPTEDSVCKCYADKFLQADIYDEQKIDDFINNNPIDGVISDECDLATPIVASIAEKYGLSGIGKELAKLYTNKYEMREFCKKIKIAHPRYKMCRTYQEVELFFEEMRKPIIIKPLDSNSSKGVFTITNSSQINKYFNESICYSKVEKAVIAEEYIFGTEFTIDGVKTSNNHYTLAISEKKHYKHNNNIANELFFTHKNDKFDYDLLKEINDRFVLQSGLPFGLTHAEYKYSEGKFYLIEIAARGGGNRISSIITKYMCGYNAYEYLIDCILGNIVEKRFDISDEYRDRAAVLKFFETPEERGIVKEVKGTEFLRSNSSILDYHFTFNIGNEIKECISDSARIGYFIACSESKQELNMIKERIMNEVEFII